MSLTLKGTTKELESSRAKRILDAATYASLPIHLAVLSGPELEKEALLSKSLVLCFGDSKTTTTISMLRMIASIVPAKSLLGNTDADDAIIDGWLRFFWTSFDLPLEALQKRPSSSDAIIQHIEQSFDVIDEHLMNKKYFIGESVTLADIYLTSSLEQARNAYSPAAKTNVNRWYKRMMELRGSR